MTKSILFVDDNPELLSLCGMMFERKGYRVLKAFDGAGALKIMEETAPDLFVLDIMMPEINGIELCQRIRALPQFEHTPVIFLSAYSDTEIVEKTFAAGANDFIRKPIDAPKLEAKVREFLEAAQA